MVKMIEIINELSDDEQNTLLTRTWNVPSSVTDWLESKDLHEIGRGNFSRVYGKEGYDKVVKVNFKIDAAYKKFIEYVKAHPCDYFPKIYDSKELTKDKGVYLYIIEQLDSVGNIQRFFSNHFEKYYPFLMGMNAIHRGAVDRLSLGSIVRSYQGKKFHEETGLDMFDNGDEYYNFRKKEVEDYSREFFSTRDGAIIRKFFEDKSFSYDLHPANIMLRPGTDQIVIVDPVY